MYALRAEREGRAATPPALAQTKADGRGGPVPTGDCGLVIERHRGGASTRPILARSDRPVLVLIERGTAMIGCGSFRAELNGDHAALLARSGVATLVMDRDAAAVTISFDRVAFQRAATWALGLPHQLVAGNAALSLTPSARAALAAAQGGTAIAMLVAALGEQAGPKHPLRRAEPLIRAIAYLDAYPDLNVEDDALAAAAGVGLRSLRQVFLDVLGISLCRHLLQLRLERSRELLSSGFETRPIGVIAALAGFASPSAFVKVYHRRFGEAPAQTRSQKARESQQSLNIASGAVQQNHVNDRWL